MDTHPKPSVSPSSQTGAAIDVAALLERFAPLGREQRKRQRIRRFAGLTALCVLPALAFILATQLELNGAGNASQATIAVAPDAATTARLAALQQQSAEIEARAADLRRRENELAQREQALQKEDALLASRMTELEARQRSLAEARMALERAQKSTNAATTPTEPSFGRRVVEQELAALKKQRADLELQRQTLDSQRQQLQSLMEQYAEVAGQPASAPAPIASPPTTSAVDGNKAPDTEPLLMASSTSLGDEVLGQTRGAFRVGPDLDVSFGLTRSASINGVEQFSSSMQLDGVEAVSNAALNGTMGPIVIQTGAGNVISPEVMDALSSGFGAVIQNTMDSQVIDTKTVIDVSIGNVGAALDNITGSQVVSESLYLQRP